MEKTLGKWVVCLMIGSIVGMLAYGIRWTVEMLNEVKYDISDKYIFFNFSFLPFFCFFPFISPLFLFYLSMNSLFFDGILLLHMHGIYGFLIYYGLNIAFATGSYLCVLFGGVCISPSSLLFPLSSVSLPLPVYPS